uniref:Uncharacterized protein n=1 Tax=Arundo donax TaxID=35708 RepID=A0A0A8ZDI1_ARUDO
MIITAIYPSTPQQKNSRLDSIDEHSMTMCGATHHGISLGHEETAPSMRMAYAYRSRSLSDARGSGLSARTSSARRTAGRSPPRCQQQRTVGSRAGSIGPRGDGGAGDADDGGDAGVDDDDGGDRSAR